MRSTNLSAIATWVVLVTSVQTGLCDEFVGPFASWANVKTDYGALGGGKPIPDEGTVDPEFIRDMLVQTRGENPRRPKPIDSDVTDLRLYRVSVYNTQIGIHLTR